MAEQATFVGSVFPGVRKEGDWNLTSEGGRYSKCDPLSDSGDKVKSVKQRLDALWQEGSSTYLGLTEPDGRFANEN